MSETDLTDQRLLELCVRSHLPQLKSELSFSRINTGKFNTSYFVEHEGTELVLRIAQPPDSVFLFYERDMMRQEPALHRLLREQTSVPVAEILAFDDRREIIDRDFLIMERLPGIAAARASGIDYSRTLEQVGKSLAEVHALTRDRHGYLGEHAPMEPQASWVEAFQIMWRKLIEDIAGVGHYSNAEVKAFLDLLDPYLPLFDRPIEASLLHMDVWAENILVDAHGNLAGLIDWDRALWGDPEIEFAVLDYCGISEAPFWRGYGKERDISDEARVRQVFYLLYELQKYIVIRQGRNRDPERARDYKRQVMQIVRSTFGGEVS